MKILLTSGGTKVKIDRVRHIGNMSRGTFGSRIARKMFWHGVHTDFSGIFSRGGQPQSTVSTVDELTFLYAKDSRRPYQFDVDVADEIYDPVLAMEAFAKLNVEYREYAQDRLFQWVYSDYDEYREKLFRALEGRQPDLVVLAAAVSDYLVKDYVDGKIRSQADLDIHLEPAQKLIGTVKAKCPNCKLVGFKLMVDSTDDELIAAARKSIADNGCDMVVANDLRDIKKGNHRVRLVTPEGLLIHSSGTSDPMQLPGVVAQAAMSLVSDRIDPFEVETWESIEYYEEMELRRNEEEHEPEDRGE